MRARSCDTARRHPRGFAIRDTQAEALHILWREIAAYSAAETDAALLHLMQWIAKAIDADNVIWIGGGRVLQGAAAQADPFLGWRLRARRALQPDPPAYRKQLATYYDREHYGKLTPTYSHAPHDAAHVGMDSRATMSGTGRFRVHRLRDKDLLDFAAFRRTLHYRLYYYEPGIVDRMMIGFPVADGRESFFLIDRFQKPGAGCSPGGRRSLPARPRAACPSCTGGCSSIPGCSSATSCSARPSARSSTAC